jgi:hypothetical protein
MGSKDTKELFGGTKGFTREVMANLLSKKMSQKGVN